MKTLKMAFTALALNKQILEKMMLTVILILAWLSLPSLIRKLAPTAALPDTGIWQLLLLSLLCYVSLADLANKKGVDDEN